MSFSIKRIIYLLYLINLIIEITNFCVLTLSVWYIVINICFLLINDFEFELKKRNNAINYLPSSYMR